MIGEQSPFRCLTVLLALWAAASTQPAAGQFVPGHVFVARTSVNLCETDKWGLPYDEEYIIELDPERQVSRVFATIPRELCGVISGLTFSPDGRRLRVSSLLLWAILEFDAQGKMTIPLDWQDGIRSVPGCNGITYDEEGYFYVAQAFAGNFLRFPPDGGKPTVLAQDTGDPEGVNGPASIAIARNRDLFVVDYGFPYDRLLRVDPDGGVFTLDQIENFINGLTSVTVDRESSVYALGYVDGTKVFKYPAADLSSREILVACPEFMPICGTGSVVASPDSSQIYASRVGYYVISINPADGSYEVVFPADGSASSCVLAVVPLRGDLNGDGIVDLDDYTLMNLCMGSVIDVADTNPRCNVADLDVDGDVDLFDFRFLQWAFGGDR